MSVRMFDGALLELSSIVGADMGKRGMMTVPTTEDPQLVNHWQISTLPTLYDDQFPANGNFVEKCTFEGWTHLPNQPGVFRIFTIIAILTILVILVVVGNALVIAAVMMRRRLRSATGLLILSLAVADLMVGLVILPFSIANEVLDSYWIFGDYWCTAWLTMDIWMCTASIYNLVAISIDRYIAIIKPLNYPMLVTKFRARCMVAAVWISSFIICSPSFLLASSDKKSMEESLISTHDPDECRCTPANSGTAYIIFSASSSFYIPMAIVIFVYARIYVAACAATKSAYSGMMQVTATANKNPKDILMQNPSALSRADNIPILRVHRGSTVKIPGNEKQFETTRNRLFVEGKKVPISINSSTPTVYAQVNGSCNSLQYIKKNTARTSRRYSDEKPLGHSSTGTELRKISSRNMARRSIGNIHQGLHESPTALLGETSLSNLQMKAIDENETVVVSSAGLDSRRESRQSERMQWKEQSGRGNEEDEREEGQEHSALIPGESGDTTSSMEDEQGMRAKNATYTGVPNINSSNKKSKGQQVEPKKELQQQTSQKEATKKKRNYGAANLLARLIGRGPRKRAGCAYEKRLSLEIKAAKTVAIVTGCFIFCWFGFSILYGFSFCLTSNDVVWSVVFWLGYLNSALNPVIYTVFNREFRTCFKKLLTCNNMLFKNRNSNYQPGAMYNSYNSQLRQTGRFPPIGGYNSMSAPPWHSQRTSIPMDTSEDT